LINVLFASAEAVPFAKVGGMADVVGALPEALRRLGVDARVILPGYGFIPHQHKDYEIRYLFSFDLPRKTDTSVVSVFTTTYHGVPVYFVQGWPFLGQEDRVYSDWERDMPRFLFFNQAVVAAAWELRQRLDWFPDVFHVNDWHTGLIPFLLYENRNNLIWKRVASVLTIHNMAYQGDNAGGWLWELGIPGRDQFDLVYQDLTDNLMAIAIAYANAITTVSPRYALEIQYPYQGYGLDGLIRTRLDDLSGIINGIDTELWNPATDKALVSNFNARNFEKKRLPNKSHLQSRVGLPVRDDVLVIGLVSRLVWQKGIDLAIPALQQLLVSSDVQFVGLGAGEPRYMHEMRRLGQDFNWRARTYLDFDATLAQQIYAGCDLFLMPSHFEPCGIGQMMAMRYGALPLVRETGGLADTVENYDNGPADKGTGFLFSWQESNALLNTLRWAVDTYRNKPEIWRKMQKRAMQIDFSWDRSAQQYLDVYQKAIEQQRGSTLP
jgi:starch synthase